MSNSKHMCLFLILVAGMAHAVAQSRGTVVIGRQEWMTENLNVDHYRDGEPIPEARTAKQWNAYNESKVGCYCNYDNEGAYGSMYGKLYNWYAIRRGVAPHCWRMPDKSDYDKLIAAVRADSAGAKLKARHSWNNDWNGNNESGFGALAGGCRNANGTFSYVGREGFWWTRDSRKTGNNETGLIFFVNYDDRCNFDISGSFGFSVRCVRDVGVPPPSPCP